MSFSLTESATSLVASLGYTGLVVGLVVDSAGIPVPSEVLLPLAGALVSQGRFNLTLVLLIGILAQTLGAIIAYWIAATGGVALAERYGKYVFFSKREMDITERWFKRHGYWLALVGRCVPVIRTYVGFSAGLARMPFGVFVTASLIGSALWTSLLVWLGMRLGSEFGRIDQVLSRFSLVIVGLLVVGAIWYLRRHLSRKD